MGIKGLWQLLEPTGKAISPGYLSGKVLAVDISIWLHQLSKGMRDKDGNPLPNAHLIGLFKRTCKLLFFGIKPVFIFDGSVPVLKKQTILRRQKRRAEASSNSRSTARKVLNKLLQKHAIRTVLGADGNLGVAKEGRERTKNKNEEDIFLLPPLENPLQPERTDEDGDDDNDSGDNSSCPDNHSDALRTLELGFSQDDVDFDSEDFKNLPAELKLELLVEFKEKNKRSSWDKLSLLPKDPTEFSAYQIQRLMNFNKITRLIDSIRCDANKNLPLDSDHSGSNFVGSRIASREDVRFVLTKRKSQVDCLDATSKKFCSEEQKTLDFNPGDLKPWEEMFFQGEVPHGGSGIKYPMNERFVVVTRVRAELESKTRSLNFPATSKIGEDAPESLRDKSDDDDDDDDDDDFLEVPPLERFDGDAVLKEEVVESFVEAPTPEDAGGSVGERLGGHDPMPVQDQSKTTDRAGDNRGSSGVSMEILLSRNVEELGEETQHRVDPMEGSLFGSTGEEPSVDDVPRKILGGCGEFLVPAADVCDVVEVTPELNDRDEEEKEEEEEDDEDEVNELLLEVLEECKGASEEITLDSIERRLTGEVDKLKRDVGKSERMATSISDQMHAEVQDLLRLFGVPYLVGPAEAEAQCAFLDASGQTEGTITDDSDVFLFGARRVVRHLFDRDEVSEMYTMEDIEGRLLLSRDDMICVGMLCGSDYTEGIWGIGPVTAVEVVQEFKGQGVECLVKFKDWWTNARRQKTPPENETKVKTQLRRVHLPEGFPNKVIFNAYTNPLVDSSTEPFQWSAPNLELLEQFALNVLNWTRKQIDDMIVPLTKKLNDRKSQKRMTDYFDEAATTIPLSRLGKKLKSKRVRRVVNVRKTERKKVSGAENKGQPTNYAENVIASKTELKKSSKKIAAPPAPAKAARPRAVMNLSEESSDEDSDVDDSLIASIDVDREIEKASAASRRATEKRSA